MDVQLIVPDYFQGVSNQIGQNKKQFKLKQCFVDRMTDRAFKILFVIISNYIIYIVNIYLEKNHKSLSLAC